MKYLSKFFFPFYAGGVLNITTERIFNVVFRYIGVIILEILQFLYSFFIIVNVNIHRIYVFIQEIFKKTNTVKFYDYIREQGKTFKKIPQHVLIITGGEKPSYQDFVKIITWCITTGISHISFYDHYDDIDCHAMFDNVCQHAKHFLPSIKWGKSFTEKIKKESKGYINGFTWSPLVTVNIYQSQDTSSAVLSTILHQASESSSNQLDPNNQSLEMKISKTHSPTSRSLPLFLQRFASAPDPDLAIITGPTLCTYGFPPWQLRLTEFIYIPTHRGIDCSTFLHILRKFSDCEQRFGN